MLINETYEGQVEHVSDNVAIVVYNVNGELIEQTYVKSQFIGNKFPEVGTCVRVSVVVTEFEPELPPDEPEKPSHRTPLTGPEEL
jgi:hypothetical protein